MAHTWSHPELQDDDVLVANISDSDWQTWMSSFPVAYRIGCKAFRFDNRKPITKIKLRPLFVPRADLAAAYKYLKKHLGYEPGN